MSVFDSIFSGVAGIIHWIFGGNSVPTQLMARPPDAYDPIKGRHLTGFLDNPTMQLKTYIPPPPKDIDLIISKRVKDGTHVTQKPIYQAAYTARKMKNFNMPHEFLDETYKKGKVRQERRIMNINGEHISSRDKKNTLNHTWKTGSTPYQSAMNKWKITANLV